MRRASACVLLLLVALGASSCGSDTSKEDEAAAARKRAAAAAHARSLEIGRRAFAEHCQLCHTLAGRRFKGPIVEFLAPNLDEVRMKRSYLRERIDSGGPAMASFIGTLSRAEYRGVMDYVMETAGRNVDDDGGQSADELAAGEEVFAQHCAVCHGIAGRPPTGRPVYVGTDFTVLKPSSRWVLKRMDEGVLAEYGKDGMMPSFRDTLTDAEMRAVAAYVSAVAMEPPKPTE